MMLRGCTVLNCAAFLYMQIEFCWILWYDYMTDKLNCEMRSKTPYITVEAVAYQTSKNFDGKTTSKVKTEIKARKIICWKEWMLSLRID